MGYKENQKKCIFIYVHQGFAVRYLLRSEIFNTLKRKSHEIVIFSHNGDEWVDSSEEGQQELYEQMQKELNKKCAEIYGIKNNE